MSFLAPWAMIAGVAAALGVLALHLLTTRRPPEAPLPTARFVPEADVRAVARASRPTDLLLLALRTLAVLAIGAAFAKPVFDAPGPNLRSVYAIERSRGVIGPAEFEAALAAIRQRAVAGDAFVLFDTSARVVARDVIDTLRWPTDAPRVARLSPMFVAARDAAASIARGADSIRLVIVSSLVPESVDAATLAWRRAWPGRVELVRLAGAADTLAAPTIELRSPLADDPLAPAISALPRARGAQRVRIVRDAATSSDSGWLAETNGVLIEWPLAPPASDSASGPDAVAAWGGIAGVEPTLVAPLLRLDAGDGHVIARWRDGAPAATEQREGEGCSRTIGIGIPLAADLTLRSPFGHFLAAMVAPCGGHRSPAIPDSLLTWLTGDGALASARALEAEAEQASPLTMWLLLLAVAALVAEQLLRRRPAREVA
jgi:hypothetical protein